MMVGVLLLPGRVGVDAVEDGEAAADAARDAAAERLLVDDEIAAAAAASKGAAIRVNCSVMPRG